MNSNQKILAVIPARSGSKGVKNKNIKILGDKPLVCHSIESALASNLITDVVVSTDSEEISKIAKESGAQVPFIRPKKLAIDIAESYPVIHHAILEMQTIKEIKYDYFIMLQPTSPFRSTDDINLALNKLIDSNFDSIVSVVDVGGFHPLRMKKINNNGMLLNYVKQEGENMLPRQKLEPVFIRNGSIYASKTSVLFSYDSLVGPRCLPYIMSSEKSINIDSKIDFKIAENIILDNK